jgi:hypothetical protein
LPGGIMQLIGLMFQHFPIMYIWELRYFELLEIVS